VVNGKQNEDSVISSENIAKSIWERQWQISTERKAKKPLSGKGPKRKNIGPGKGGNDSNQ